MKAVNYTIRDYEHFVNMQSGMLTYGAMISESYNIDESKGIVDNYLPIIDELYEAICSTQPIPFNDDKFYLSYALTDYKMRQDCFIDSLTLVVCTKSNLNSNFRGENAEILKNGLKLRNIKLNIFINSSDIRSNNGKEEFYSNMSHELQHVYRFYSILLSDNKRYKDEEIVRMWRGNEANQMLDCSDDETPQNNISKLYYLSDTNEIASEANRLYEYIRSNEDINYNNYHLMQERLPLYVQIINLERGIDKIENGRRDGKFVEEYGNIYKSIIGDTKSTPSKAIMKFRTRLINGYLFALRDYRRTLIKAFEDFDRFKTDFNENKVLRTYMKFGNEVENRDDFNELMEILNKH